MKREIKRENGHISYHLWKHEMKFQDRLFNYMGHIICIVVDITHINTHIGPCYRVNCILAFPSKMIHFISFWDQEAYLRICMVPYWFIIDQISKTKPIEWKISVNNHFATKISTHDLFFQKIVFSWKEK